MKKLKNQTKILYIMILVAFFLIWQKLTAKTIVQSTKPTYIEPYIAKYFRDSEYFASQPIPVEYYENWVKLVKILDKIRTAFSSAILIQKGYVQPCDCGEPLDDYMMCKAVIITAQNKDNNFLYGQSLTLKIGGYIDVKELYQNENKSITIKIN